jgi:hypothetical protein
MWGFKDAINSKYGLNLQTYDDLYRWSIENISQFWADTWSFTGVEASQPFKKVGGFFGPWSRASDFTLSTAFNGHDECHGTTGDLQDIKKALIWSRSLSSTIADCHAVLI